MEAVPPRDSAALAVPVAPTNGPQTRTQAAPEEAEEAAAEETVSDIIDSLGRNREAVVAIVSTIGSEFTKARDANMHVNKHLSWMVFAFMALIVVGSGFLVYTGKMSDGALTFLVGVMVGYMMRFVDRLNLGGGRAE